MNPRRSERERLAAKAARGDTEAFSALASFYRPRLVEYVRRQGVDPERTEDIVQEVFLRAWEMRATYAPGGSWIKWCQQIATRLLIDEWRRENMIEFVSLEGLASSEEEVPSFRDPAPLPDALVIAQESAERVERALRRLSPAQKTTLRMRLEGRSFEEIATLLQTARSTVRIYLYRARNVLRGLLWE